MDISKFSKLLNFLRESPVWVRVVVIIIAIAVSCIVLFSSCGVPRTTVTVSQGGNSTIEQSTTSTTTITVTAEKKE